MPSVRLCEPTMFKSISKVQIGLPMNENEKCVSAEKNNNLIRTLDILLLVKKNLLKIYRKKKMSYNVSFNSFEPKNLVTLKKVKAEQKR